MSIINKFLLECDDKTVGAYIIIYFVWLQVRVADPDPNLFGPESQRIWIRPL